MISDHTAHPTIHPDTLPILAVSLGGMAGYTPRELRDVQRRPCAPVSVAACLADRGVPVIATGFVGTNEALRRPASAKSHFEDRLVRIGGTGGSVQQFRSADLAELRRNILQARDRVSVAVISGTIPAGAPAEFLILLAIYLGQKVRVIFDVSGVALDLVLALHPPPFCVSTTRRRLEIWSGRALTQPEDLLSAARVVLSAGVPLVSVFLEDGGAILLTGPEALHVRCPGANASRAVGASAAMTAGLAAAFHGERAPESLEGLGRLGAAFAAAQTAAAGPSLHCRGVVASLARQAGVMSAARWARRAADRMLLS